MSSSAPAYRATSRRAAYPAGEKDAFEQRVSAIAAEARDAVPNLDERDRKWLGDLARTDVRYPMVTVRRLCALLKRCRRVTLREAFAELIRGECASLDGVPDPSAAFDVETPAPGKADVSQRAFEQDPNPITYTRARADLVEQRITTDLSIASLDKWAEEHLPR